MSEKKQTNQASPSQIENLLAKSGQEDPTGQEVEKLDDQNDNPQDEVKVEDFLGDIDGKEIDSEGKLSDLDVIEKLRFLEKETPLPKYDYLKINSRFLDSDNVGQVFKKNTATGEYDKIIEKVKEKYDTLISLGYEIHSQTSILNDYILFTFKLPVNDNSAS